MVDVVIAGASPNGLMLACELGLAGIRPVVLDPASGPNPQARVNRIVGQAARILDHRGLYSALTGTAEPPKPAPHSVFAGFPLELAAVPDSQLFVIPVQQRGLVQVLAERAGEYEADIRWGHALTGFDQHDDGVTVHVAGPDGAYDLTAEYFVGADGGHSKTRHLAGIEFPGMSSYDLVVRIGFNVVPPDEWLAPVGGAPDAPGSGQLPPQRFHRTDRGVFAFGAMGNRVAVMTYELDSDGPEQRERRQHRRAAHEPGRVGGQRQARAGYGCAAAARIAGRANGFASVLRHQLEDRVALPGRPGDTSRRCRARPRADWRTGPQSEFAGRGEPRMEAGGGFTWARSSPTLLDTYETERRPAAERLIMQSRSQLALFRPGPEVTALRELFSELLTEPACRPSHQRPALGADNRYTHGRRHASARRALGA